MIDARMQAALARLTDNEKECLRRRLQQQTAKEMALDLGVSPHAVEKRLKMARTKLGLSSSLEAARLLAASEGYQRTGPQTSDLTTEAPSGMKQVSPLALGVLSMAILAAVVIAFATQVPGVGGVAPLDAGGVVPYPSSGGTITDPAREEQNARTTAEQFDAVVTQNFAGTDRDRSGFIEPSEVPAPTEEADRQFIAAGDKNGDGKLDLAEYHGWAAQIIAQRGGEWRNYVEEYSRADD